jgi:peptidoglycan/xylan/chitin deacetylase (PgdA/CDA1 family)
MSKIKRLYLYLYDRSPMAVKSILTKSVFLLSKKPFVKQCELPHKNRFPNSYKGCMVISADFEMAWAWRYSKIGNDPLKMGLRERYNVPYIIDMFEKYDFPITWAIVGHLFLDKCKKKDGRAHSDLRRIPYFENRWNFNKGDWYDHDPSSSYKDAPAWYAPDLIQMILNSKIEHEIGCHTFSHLNCSDKDCPPEVLDDEIGMCVALAKNIDISLHSMVFPGGTNGNYAILRKYGFTNYRINDDDWDLFYPEKDKFGLWRLPSSTSLGADDFDWSLDYRLKRYRKYIDTAISKNTVFHLWFHPSLDDFSMTSVFPGILDYACEKRDRGELWITTMGDLAAYCESVSSEAIDSGR